MTVIATVSALPLFDELAETRDLEVRSPFEKIFDRIQKRIGTKIVLPPLPTLNETLIQVDGENCTCKYFLDIFLESLDELIIPYSSGPRQFCQPCCIPSYHYPRQCDP